MTSSQVIISWYPSTWPQEMQRLHILEKANGRIKRGQGGASAASSSSTMQEEELEDSEGDTEEDSDEDYTY